MTGNLIKLLTNLTKFKLDYTSNNYWDWVVLGTAIFSLSLSHSLTHSLQENISKSQKALLVRCSRTCIQVPCIQGGHPLLSGQFSKSQFFVHTNTVCLRRKTDNIFLFNAPFLFVISLNCWLQIDIGETWSLWRTWLLSTWLKICSNIYQSWCVKSACFTMYLPASQIL